MRLALCALLVLAACGGPAEPSATTVDGAPGGVTFKNPTAIYSKRDKAAVSTPLSSDTVTVLITDEPDACGKVEARGVGRTVIGRPDNATAPSLMLKFPERGALTDDQHALGDGFESDLDPGQPATNDPSSKVTGLQFVTANSGRVEVARSDDMADSGAIAAGSFEVVYPGGGTVKGTFRATPCAKVDSGCSTAPGMLMAWLVPGLAFALRRRRA